MKRYILLLFIAIGFMESNAQVPDVFYIIKSESAFSSFFCNEVKSIQYSKTDAEGMVHEKYVTQIIETSDSLYSIPLVGASEVSFVTPADQPMENGITPGIMVDLGLSVMWASHNIGATTNCEYGGLYGWADPIGKKRSDNPNDYPSADFNSDISGTEYDIARAKWGANWRIPTQAENQELLDLCVWSWITHRSIKGMKVTGPNGNSIFLPATGYRKGLNIWNQGNFGYYWSSTSKSSGNEVVVYNLGFNYHDGYEAPFRSIGTPTTGSCVRPVTSK